MQKGLKRFALLALVLCVLVLYGCSTDVGGTSAREISDYDSVQFFPVDNNSEDESTADISDVRTESHEPAESHEPLESYEPKDYSENVTTQGSGFVVSDKMYDFEGNNLVVLNVENKTGKNYSIYIHGQYLDENGEVLKEETKEFRGFEAGWKNNFFFIPEMPFAKFTYKIETKAYTGKCYGSIFSITYSWERKDDYNMSTGQPALAEWEANGRSGDYDWENYVEDALWVHVMHEYESEEPIALKEQVIILSSDGKILRAPYTKRVKMHVGSHFGYERDSHDQSFFASDAREKKLFEAYESGNEPIIITSIAVAKLWDDSDDDRVFEW